MRIIKYIFLYYLVFFVCGCSNSLPTNKLQNETIKKHNKLLNKNLKEIYNRISKFPSGIAIIPLESGGEKGKLKIYAGKDINDAIAFYLKTVNPKNKNINCAIYSSSFSSISPTIKPCKSIINKYKNKILISESLKTLNSKIDLTHSWLSELEKQSKNQKEVITKMLKSLNVYDNALKQSITMNIENTKRTSLLVKNMEESRTIFNELTKSVALSSSLIESSQKDSKKLESEIKALSQRIRNSVPNYYK